MAIDIKSKNVRISELQGRPDFADILAYGLNPLLLDGQNEEPSQFEQLFTRFELTRNNVPFPTFKGLTVGKIVEGQEIPFISLGTGTQTISAEDVIFLKYQAEIGKCCRCIYHHLIDRSLWPYCGCD